MGWEFGRRGKIICRIDLGCQQDWASQWWSVWVGLQVGPPILRILEAPIAGRGRHFLGGGAEYEFAQVVSNFGDRSFDKKWQVGGFATSSEFFSE
jgi:hypothetical protein